MERKNEVSIWERIATFIVDKRNGIFLFYILACVFCVVASGWVRTNEDLTDYLPEDTETKQGLVIMGEEFTTYATAQVMVSNITLTDALQIKEEIGEAEGVASVTFYDPETEGAELSDYYAQASALFSVTFEGETEDEVSRKALNEIRALLKDYDLYVNSEVGNGLTDTLDGEMQVVLAVSLAIIVLVLLFTSRTYLEVPVLLLTFGAATLLNSGTNFLLGEISFISNSISSVLQLALAIDYAIILCHRYSEERERHEAREACIVALSKSIPEVSSSSLTTICGLIAMMFMQFRIGFDMGLVLVKAIFLSLVTVFTLMPGLLMLFSRGIDRTHHRNFVPKITGWGRIVVKTRYIVPPIFVVLLVAAFIFSNRCPYVYGYSTLSTFKKSETQIAAQRIEDTFGSSNAMVLVVPSGDYAGEKALLQELEQLEHMEFAMGLSNIEVQDGYMLTDQLTPRELAELMDMDLDMIRLLYTAYAADQENYGQIISGLDDYRVPLIDMFFFLFEQQEEGFITLEESQARELQEMHELLTDAKAQMAGADYSRMILSTDLPEESQETFDYLSIIHKAADKYYDEVYLLGNSTSDYDQSVSFQGDNLLISILSALFVIIVLVFTFRSAGLPVLLILVIEGSIWMNFSIPTLTSQNVFFMSYLIVSSIQMGANIDYAIVISSRYLELKERMDPKEAIVEALNLAFPTVVTSGTIMASSGILISFLSSEIGIASIGTCLGRGTLISIVLVLCVLPQILVLGDKLIERTAFTIRPVMPIAHTTTGNLRVNGHVKGYVNGVVDAQIHGTVKGTVSAAVAAGVLDQEDDTAAAGTPETEAIEEVQG